jgi:hypothetical protein
MPCLNSLGSRPVPIEPELDVPHRDVRFGEIVIELERLERRGLRFRNRFYPVRAEEQVRVGEPGVCKRVLRVLVDRLLEVLDGLFESADCALVPVSTAPQVSW